MTNTLYLECPKCGNKIILMDGIYNVTCTKCLFELEYNRETEQLEAIKKRHDVPQPSRTSSQKSKKTLGERRTYFYYFIFGIFSLGIGFIFYLFWTIKDLESHDNFPEVEKKAAPVSSDTDLFMNFSEILRNRIFYSPRYMAIIALVTVTYDVLSLAELKYSSLYNHLKNQEKKTAPIKSPHSAIYMIGLITFLISAAVTIPTGITAYYSSATTLSVVFWVFCGFMIAGFLITMICSALWQTAFNQHIKALNKMGYK